MTTENACSSSPLRIESRASAIPSLLLGEMLLTAQEQQCHRLIYTTLGEAYVDSRRALHCISTASIDGPLNWRLGAEHVIIDSIISVHQYGTIVLECRAASRYHDCGIRWWRSPWRIEGGWRILSGRFQWPVGSATTMHIGGLDAS